MAVYRVKIGWAGRNAGVFQVGNVASKIAPAVGSVGYAKIGYPYTPSYVGTYDDLSGTGRYMCSGFDVTRGRDDEFAQMAAGQATIRLNDVLPGRYNPKNASSPLFGLLRPMRPCLIQGSVDGITYYDLFHGWLEELSDNPDFGVNEATLTFKDLFLWFDRAKNITIPSTGPIYVGQAIGLVADQIGWVNPAKRSLQLGTLLPDFSAVPGPSGLQIIAEMLEIDLGTCFISRQGVLTYYDRYQTARMASLATIAAASGSIPGVSLARVKNEITVTRTGGVPQYFENTASVNEFGDSAWESIDSRYLATDGNAASLAQFKVARGKEPVAPNWAFTVSEGPAGYLASILQADLLGRYTIPTNGVNSDYHIQKITHAAGPGGELFKSTWVLSERVANQPFLVGRGKIAPTIASVGYDRVPY